MHKTTAQPIRIGQVAQAADVGIDTIRFYERRGLLPEPPRSESGYRAYTPATITRLRFITRAKQLGFNLDEIKSLLALQKRGGQKAEVKAMTHRKLEQVEAKIEALSRMRDVLQQLDNDCSGSGDLTGCPIIESLCEGVQGNDTPPMSEAIL
ncbi:MAG: heavy metal-responsive transcriptional regulator [Proteobacteria bacterium]|nr:heavy metal-responsive transcriptional regulator [Pseudomonadota bacterium]